MSNMANDAGVKQAGRRFVIIGNPGSVRVEGFLAALDRHQQPLPVVVPYRDLIAGEIHLGHIVRAGDVVRLESPGRDWEVERALLRVGAEVEDDENTDDRFLRLARSEVEELNSERGCLIASRQWFLGWRATLSLISRQLIECPRHRVMNRPSEIAEMFDKPGCHTRLLGNNIAVPRTLGVPVSYDDLTLRMKRAACRRVFVKLAHGSSGAGIVAFRTDGQQRYQAYTTTEVVQANGRQKLYNSRRIRTLRNESEIAEVINALCRHRVHVEEWLPKANFKGKAFDLRVVLVAGQARQAVVRLSRSPMTNLHLLNERADVHELRAVVPDALWQAAMRTCSRAVGLYPESFYCGVDLLFTQGFAQHAILELNAFGDLLLGVQCAGEDTYTTQIKALAEMAA